MIRVIIFVIFQTVTIISFCQISTKGSFIIAAICKDGIIIGADSRLTLTKDGKPTAYIDSVQKIFPGKDYAIALMGLANVGDYNISYLSRKFSDSLFNRNNMGMMLFYWIKYLQETVPNVSINFDAMEMLFAGYDKTTGANLTIYKKDNSIVKRKKGFYSRDSTTFNNKYSLEMSCKEAKKWIGEAIYEYAERKIKQRP